MLSIFNKLGPFFRDCYEEINVREYARRQGISPPTASCRLKRLAEEGLLVGRSERRYLLYRANRENPLFVELSRSFWRQELERIGLLGSIRNDYLAPIVILFGSLSKAEAHPRSDIDLVIVSPTAKKAGFSKFERSAGRPIHVFHFRKLSEIPSEGLLSNIRNAYLLMGRWE